MKTFSLFLFLILFVFVACQSAPKRELRALGLQGQQVAFYRMLSVPEGRSQEGDMLLVFKNDGHYVGLLDGSDFDYGEYTYQVLKKPEEAEITFYPKLMEKEEKWTYHMSYTSPYSGYWKLVRQDNSNHALAEVGNFRFLR